MVLNKDVNRKEKLRKDTKKQLIKKNLRMFKPRIYLKNAFIKKKIRTVISYGKKNTCAGKSKIF